MTVDVLIFTGTFNGLTRPAGAYRIATELRKHGYSVQVVDAFLHLTEENSDQLNAIIDKFVGSNTLWVGFSTTFFSSRRRMLAAIRSGQMSSAEADDAKLSFSSNKVPLTTPEVLNMRRAIKSRSPNCKLVFGGAKAPLQEAGIIDVYIEGYADTTVIEFTRWCQGKNPFFRYTSHPGIPNVTVPYMSVEHDPKAASFDFVNSQIRWDASDCIQRGEALPIEVSRGCIFSCSFCSYPLNGKKKLDFIKDPAILIDELTRNYELFGTTEYIYSDDTHNDNVEKLEILYNQVYSKLPFKLGFYTYLRLDLLAAHSHTIDLLKESGLRGAFFGIESLNYQSAKTIGKGLRPEKALDTLYAVRERWGVDVKTSAGFIVGLPHETEQTASSWLDKVTDLKFPLDCAHIYPLFISNKIESKIWRSELETNADKYGYKFDENGSWYNDDLSFDRSDEIVKGYLARARANRKRQLSDFTIPGMLNLGYTHAQLLDVQLTDLNQADLSSRRRKLHNDYYQRLMAL